jgi:hypothetical protein
MQSAQLEGSLCPTADWYFPAAHKTQALLPVIPAPLWYVPAPHCVQLALLAIPDPLEYAPG